MMLLRSQSISYFKVKRIIWLKVYQNGSHTEPSEQRLKEISIEKNWPRAGLAVDRKSKGRRFEFCARSIFRNAYFLQPLFWRLCVVAVLVTLKPDSTLNVEIWVILSFTIHSSRFLK